MFFRAAGRVVRPRCTVMLSCLLFRTSCDKDTAHGLGSHGRRK
jgi:hypothetical protein